MSGQKWPLCLEPVPGKGPASRRTAQCHGCSASALSHPAYHRPSSVLLSARLPFPALPSLFILPPLFSLILPSRLLFSLILRFLLPVPPSFLPTSLTPCVFQSFGLRLSRAPSLSGSVLDVLLVTVWPRAGQRLHVCQQPPKSWSGSPAARAGGGADAGARDLEKASAGGLEPLVFSLN